MSTLHTAGPWRIARGCGIFGEREMIELGIEADYSDHFPIICNTVNGLSFHSKYDARLIAAAPDLLAACEMLAFAYESLFCQTCVLFDGQGNRLNPAKLTEARDAARAAIAKATGQP